MADRSDSWIAVVDYGVGNLRSVYKALEAAGAAARIVSDPGGLAGVAGIVLPGVGAFGDAAANLRAAGFEQPLLDAIAAGTPLLGICVGMQLLFDESEEMGRHPGLGVIPGRVMRFANDLMPGMEPSGGLVGAQPTQASIPVHPLKVPQIGWNQLHHAGTDPLLAGVPNGAYAYFVHSYYCAPNDPAHTVATTDFGISYASVVRHGNVWGIQCHPEKSQAVGLRILGNFVRLVSSRTPILPHSHTPTRHRGGQMSFTIFPAIDLRHGQVVRLRQGDAAAQTVYGDDPAAVAKQWADQGARWLHVVNLDGALTPRPPLLCAGEGEAGESHIPRPPLLCAGEGEIDGEVQGLNLRRLAEIRAAVDVPIQFGGGLRTADDVAAALRLGATRVVLGTVAVRRPQVVADAVARFGAARIAVGIDARDGWVATHGWQETSALDALTVARRMADLGVQRIVYTDITRDGTLAGVNVAATVELARASGLKVIASGGVAGLADIRALAAHVSDGIEGVIVGQALYTGAVDLAAALRLT